MSPGSAVPPARGWAISRGVFWLGGGRHTHDAGLPGGGGGGPRVSPSPEHPLDQGSIPSGSPPPKHSLALAAGSSPGLDLSFSPGFGDAESSGLSLSEGLLWVGSFPERPLALGVGYPFSWDHPSRQFSGAFSGPDCRRSPGSAQVLGARHLVP